MTTTTEIDGGLSIADLHFQGRQGVVASYLIRSGDELGLVETGPSTCLPHLLDAVDACGGIDRLTAVAVTHIHLDHSGAVGQLLAQAPKARCYVHRIGAPHLIDPSKLLRSATRIYGDDMDRLWGEVLPAPGDRVVAVDDGDVIRVGGTDLRVVYTPGHASHHMALYDQERGAVFTGDVAGVRLQGCGHVRPPTPPPDIDLALWRDSVDTLMQLRPEALLLTHYGSHSGDLDRHLAQLLRRLDRWTELVRRAMEAGQDSPAIVDLLRREGDDELLAEDGDSELLGRYELGSPYGMSVDGLLRFLEKSGSPSRESEVGSRESSAGRV